MDVFFIAMGGLGGFWHAFGVEGMWAAGGQLFVSARLRRRDDVDIVCTTVGAAGGWGRFGEHWVQYVFSMWGWGGSSFVSILSVCWSIWGEFLEDMWRVW